MRNKIFKEYKIPFRDFTFVSSVDVNSQFYKGIRHLPDSVIISINENFISDRISEKSFASKDLLRAELKRLNEGGEYAFLTLEGETP